MPSLADKPDERLTLRPYFFSVLPYLYESASFPFSSDAREYQRRVSRQRRQRCLR